MKTASTIKCYQYLFTVKTISLRLRVLGSDHKKLQTYRGWRVKELLKKNSNT
nr:MAG: hypothetical protein H3BulkLitter179253_000001 [Mitovirus sp.]